MKHSLPIRYELQLRIWRVTKHPNLTLHLLDRIKQILRALTMLVCPPLITDKTHFTHMYPEDRTSYLRQPTMQTLPISKANTKRPQLPSSLVPAVSFSVPGIPELRLRAAHLPPGV